MKTYHVWSISALVLTLLVSAPALADDDVRARASQAFQEGNQAYIQKDYAKAAKLFTQAYDLQPHDRVLYYIALAYDNLGDTERALHYLQRYAKTSRSAAEEAQGRIERTRRALHWRTIDRAALSVSKAMTKASGDETNRERDRRQKLEGALKRRGPIIDDIPFGVLTDPPGVQVYVDDRSLGPVASTPVTLRLEPGTHTIWLERPFFEGFEMKIKVQEPKPGRPPQKIHTVLERRKVRVVLRTPSPKDEILFIGQGAAKRQSLGFGTWRGSLPAGESVFAVRAADGRQKLFRHTLDGNALITLTLSDKEVFASSEPEQGSKLIIRGDLPTGEVWVAGKNVGALPGPLEVNVEPGYTNVEVRKPGFRTWKSSVYVAPRRNEVVRLPKRLEPQSSGSWGGAWSMIGLGLVAGSGAGAITILDAQDRLPDGDQSSLRGTSYGLYAVAGAGLIGGLIWGLSNTTGDAPEDPKRAWIWVSPEPSGAHVQAGWVFP